MKRSLVFVMGLLVCAVLPAFSQAVVSTQSVQIPWAIAQEVSCANNGLGEIVSGSGTLQMVSVTVTNTNNVTLDLKFNPKGMKLVGETTGLVYHAVGVSRWSGTMFSGELPLEGSLINRYYFVSNTSAPNLKVTETARYTINAQGETVVAFDRAQITCQ